MKSIITIENIKCGGCMNSIRTKLNAMEGVNGVKISETTGEVSLDHDPNMDVSVIEKTLAKMGYPPAGQNNLAAKAKSYVSCMVGRIEN